MNVVPLDVTVFAHRSVRFNMQFYVVPSLRGLFPEGAFELLDGMVEAITSNMPKDWDVGYVLSSLLGF